MDIATLLESHRRYMLAELEKDYTDNEYMATAHDRATTKTLLDLYRSGQTSPNGEVKPLGQAALTTPPPTSSRRVKAGSKAARQRAIKAGETRRKNLADKKANLTTQIQSQVNDRRDGDPPALSPATHLVPRTTGGGAA